MVVGRDITSDKMVYRLNRGPLQDVPRSILVMNTNPRDMISLDPLAPGSVYTSSVDDHAKVGLYRLEVGCSPGTGKLKIAGGIEGLMRESINRAFGYLMGQKVKMGIGQQVDTTDFHVGLRRDDPAR